MNDLRSLFDVTGWKLPGIIALAGCLAAVAGVILQEVKKVWQRRRKLNVLRKHLGGDFYFTEILNHSTRYYVPPDYTNLDPALASGNPQLRPVREPLFEKMDRLLDDDSNDRHIILFADAGMGKSSFVLNYYARNQLRSRRERSRLAVVALGGPNVENYIQGIENKNETTLFLDAFEEDTKAIHDARNRLANLMHLCRNFQRVLITCRPRFFASQGEVSEQTEIVRVEPKSKRGKTYELRKLYLAPFDQKQIKLYLRRRFHLWQFGQRRKAYRLSKSIPLLGASPVLLAHMPDLIRDDISADYSFQVYDILVDRWYQREADRVEPAVLQEFSEALAAEIYSGREKRGGEFMTFDEMMDFAQSHNAEFESWKLNGRSFLNHDADNRFRFSHRSIMEYLFVKRFLNLPTNQRFKLAWTDQMKMFVLEMLKGCMDETGAVKFNLDKVDLSEFPEPLYSFRKEPAKIGTRDAESLMKHHDFYCGGDYPWTNRAGKGTIHHYEPVAGEKVIRDRIRGLCWQRSGSAERLPFTDVQEYLGRLNDEKYGGFSDWRLPTLEEAMSLLEPEENETGLHIASVFDKQQKQIWTCDRRLASVGWYIDFDGGYCNADFYYDVTFFVRAVH